MLIGEGKHVYEWIDRWAVIPNTPGGRKNGRTHGVVVSASGRVLVFHQASPAVLVFGNKGTLLNAWGDHFLGAHGMTLVEEDGKEHLWLTDQDTAEVVKTTLDGKKVLHLPKPNHPVYSGGKYSPTWVAVNEERFGGNGDVWIADGYGSNLVHLFAKDGKYLSSIDGTEGKAGKFNCPHGLWFDRRTGIPELYIADRGNKRFQVYDTEGKFKRTVGEGILSLPCTAVSFGTELLVPELDAKLTVLNEHDALVCRLGSNERACSIPGWPDHPPHLISPGKFNSPHSATVDQDGNVYVVEWIIGGRITKLQKVN